MTDPARRLYFKPEELSHRDVRKAAEKAERAADKADKALERLPTRKRMRITRDGAKAGTEHFSDKLHRSRQSSKAVRGKLRIEVTEVKSRKPGAAGRAAANVPAAALSIVGNTVRDAVGRADNDSGPSAEALQSGASSVRTAGSAVQNSRYSRRLKRYDKAEKLVRKSDRANVDALYRRERYSGSASSNPISKWRQKQELKKRYMAKASGRAGNSASRAVREKVAEGIKTAVNQGIKLIKANPKVILIAGGLVLLVALISGAFTSCTAIFAGSGNAVLGTSYTAEDADILETDADYTALEAELDDRISQIEDIYPGYDEYRCDLAEIGHNPYELASCLTVLFEDYTRAEVQSTLQSLFARQYTLTLAPEMEIRTRTETRTGTAASTDPVTGETTVEEYEYEVEVEYEYHILNVKLDNKGLGAAVRASGLTAEQEDRYDVLMAASGNRPDLFGEDVYGVSGGEYMDYDIPGEALTDERFRRMITEAERYLGFPYVWGGSDPSTSFDCSGFVSWVINHCGNGWNVGRQTADGLKNLCSIIPASEAEPGDLIFFQGTYSTSGASHVGIYVGDGMMLHCGNPVSYASIESSYWQEHFLCFGRIR